MKEYEYVMEALDGYLCDILTGVICSENYRNKSYEQGYRYVFQQYLKLHQDYLADIDSFSDAEACKPIINAFRDKCKEEQENARERFFNDMQPCTAVDLRQHAKKYLEALNQEETSTVSKRICLYPYLVTVFRNGQDLEE